MSTKLTVLTGLRVYPTDFDSDKVSFDLTGNTFVNNGKVEIWLENEAAARSGTATFVGTIECDHGDLHDHIETIPIDTALVYRIGPFPVERFGTTVTMTYAGTWIADDVKLVATAAISGGIIP